MALYQVVRAWHGVAVGDIVELGDKPHSSLVANVKPAPKGVAEPTVGGEPEAPPAPALPVAPPAGKKA